MPATASPATAAATGRSCRRGRLARSREIDAAENEQSQDGGHSSIAEESLVVKREVAVHGRGVADGVESGGGVEVGDDQPCVHRLDTHAHKLFESRTAERLDRTEARFLQRGLASLESDGAEERRDLAGTAGRGLRRPTRRAERRHQT
eukprot:scaffold4656_cov117-Isochrysis_galbana.AAC.4